MGEPKEQSTIKKVVHFIRQVIKMVEENFAKCKILTIASKMLKHQVDDILDYS